MKKLHPIFTELIQRLFADNPKFFKIVQLFSLFIALLAFLPDAFDFFEIPIPDILHLLHTKAIKLSSLTAIIMSQLPNKSDSER